MATKYVSSLTGEEMDAALIDMAYHNSEAYAVGTRNGVAVGSSDVTYHNNSKYWAEQVYGYTDRAEDAANRAEAAVPAGTAGAVFFDRAQTLTTAQQEQARANIIAGGSNPNLLDNAYFVGGGSQLGYGIFPINQKGQTSYSGAGRYIDRWVALNNDSGMTVNADGIVFNNPESGYGYVAQFKTRAKAQSGYTLSVLTVDGTVYTAQGTNDITLPSGLRFYWGSQTQLTVRVPANLTASETIAAVKYEKGTYSTILNDPIPDYQEELLKCQKGYIRFDYETGVGAIGFAYAHSTTNLTAIVTLPAKMVKTPVLSMSGSLALQQGTVRYNLTSPSNPVLNGNVLTFTSPYSVALGTATAGTMGALLLRENASFIIDANI